MNCSSRDIFPSSIKRLKFPAGFQMLRIRSEWLQANIRVCVCVCVCVCFYIQFKQNKQQIRDNMYSPNYISQHMLQGNA
jgi:hypothetical protein